MSRKHVLSLIGLAAFLSVSALAQDFPTIKFTQELWSLNPPTYSVRVSNIGNARYESTPNSSEQTGQNYTLDFNVSDSTKNKIFNALQALNFFNKTIDDVFPGMAAPAHSFTRTMAIKRWRHTTQLRIPPPSS